MILFYGKRKIRIKKYNDRHVKCDNCNSRGQIFSVYREYFHIFFIPIFPFGIKTINSICLKCNYIFNGEKRDYYLSITRTPIYLYTGVILVIIFITTVIISNINTQKQKAEYIANPKINDVYLIRQDEDKSTIYYYLKVKNIDADTVELLHSYLQYNRFVSTMSDSDYFVNNEIYRVLKSDLKKYLDSGMINSVERDYSKSSRFMIER
ncbi:MAG: zinc ribbon domain-containing protein [Bacteroidales bacterium]|jgi:hypothetical protein|nr:zinc ribbon domain-containing protein [Bacteroidales bacterium]